MVKKKLLLLMAFVLCGLSSVFAQEKEFWFSASDVAESHGDAPIFFVFTNPGNVAATVTIDCYAGAAPGVVGWTQTIVVNPKSYSKLNIANGGATPPKTIVETPARLAGYVSNYGIHITSTEKILCYYMVNNDVQRDIYSLKGAPALGTSFITPFMQQTNEYYEQRAVALYNMGSDEFEIVATQDGTAVTVNLKKRCMFGTTGTYIPANTPYTFNMNKGQTLTLREDTVGVTNTDADIAAAKNTGTLAGSMITSTKPIAVTQTEDCLSAVSFAWTPSGPSGSTDLVGDQLVPEDMVGKRYVVVNGHHSTVGERVDFVAINNGTTITVYYDGGGTLTSPTLNRGDMWNIDMTDMDGTYAHTAVTNSIFVDATEPVYCYQHTATGGELGGAILPSMYSISQQQISFYQSNAAAAGNNIFMVFREGTDTCFTISYDGGPDVKFAAAGLTITPLDIPSSVSNGWKYANVVLDNANDNRMATIKNEESTFSLGYFNGPGPTAGFGYLSGFGAFQFDPDTFWRCADNPRPVSLVGGYAKDYLWEFYPDTGYTTPTQTWTTPSIRAREKGMYVLTMDQDPRILKDTVWVLDLVFNAKVTRKPNKPAKITVPQVFTVTVGGRILPNLTYEWTFEGGTPATSNSPAATVVWNTTGQKKVTLHLSSSAGFGANAVTCDTTIIMDLMLHEKNIGYFVDEDRIDGNHDGSNWENAFQEVYQALDSASQGDCIWVAEGTYAPQADNQSFIMDYDSVEMYGGFGGWEADINERDFASHQTILEGRGVNVVTFDGSGPGNPYTSGSCGVSRATRLDGFIVRNGKSQTDGAGIVFTGGASGTVANSIVKNNVAVGNGGGVYIGGSYSGCVAGSGDALFYNTEISGNRAATGAGMYNAGSSFLSVNNTIAGNFGSDAAGLYNEGDADLRNTIIWGNVTNGALGADVRNGSGTPVYSWCNIAGWSTALGSDGTHNIDKNPIFQRAGYTNDLEMRADGVYQLSNSSPSVDKGRNPYVLAGMTNRATTVLLHPATATYSEAIRADLAGLNRIENDVVDMGAYEFHPNSEFPGLVHEVVIGTYPNLTTEPPMGIHQATAHNNFTMTLTPAEGYSLQNITITTGSEYQDEMGGMIVTHNPDGTVTVVFKEVSDPLNVQISGVSPTANLTVDNGYAIYAKDGGLCVETSQSGTLNIYSVSGQLVKQQTVSAGTTIVPLAQGLYIVTMNNGAKQKIVIK